MSSSSDSASITLSTSTAGLKVLRNCGKINHKGYVTDQDDIDATHFVDVVDALLDEQSLLIADENSSSECLFLRTSY